MFSTFMITLALIGLLAALFPRLGRIFFRTKEGVFPAANFVRITGVLLMILVLVFSSFKMVDQDKIGQLKRLYGGSALPGGHIVALSGERGPQAKILGPGLNWQLFVRILYTVEETEVLEIKPGLYGFITALDGSPLEEGQLLAHSWGDDPVQVQKMLDAEYFLTTGKGQKGPQLTVLKPGKYRYNHYLFQIESRQATDIEVGEVGVVRSNIKTCDHKGACPPIQSERIKNLSAPIVETGCQGIWKTILPPGTYYLNDAAYRVTKIDTKLQTWEYKGGYTRRAINLTLSQDGKLTQESSSIVEDVPKTAAARAVILRVEGWEVPQEIRVVGQVIPEDAPIVVASVGALPEVESRVITPIVRSVTRNVAGTRSEQNQTNTPLDDIGRVLSLQDRRPQLEQGVFKDLAPEALKTGVTIREVRFGDTVIPPELLLAMKREQLAAQLQNTYEQEKAAQEKRIEAEKARFTADQQNLLVASEVSLKAADFDAQAAEKRGRGERSRMEQVAMGQKAQMDVLGKEYTYELSVIQAILTAAEKSPDIIKVPHIFVGNGGSLDSAAAILGGGNNISQLLNATSKRVAKP